MRYYVTISGELITEVLTTGYKPKRVSIKEGLPEGCVLTGAIFNGLDVRLEFSKQEDIEVLSIVVHQEAE